MIDTTDTDIDTEVDLYQLSGDAEKSNEHSSSRLQYADGVTF